MSGFEPLTAAAAMVPMLSSFIEAAMNIHKFATRWSQDQESHRLRTLQMEIASLGELCKRLDDVCLKEDLKELCNPLYNDYLKADRKELYKFLDDGYREKHLETKRAFQMPFSKVRDICHLLHRRHVELIAIGSTIGIGLFIQPAIIPSSSLIFTPIVAIPLAVLMVQTMYMYIEWILHVPVFSDRNKDTRREGFKSPSISVCGLIAWVLDDISYTSELTSMLMLMERFFALVKMVTVLALVILAVLFSSPKTTINVGGFKSTSVSKSFRLHLGPDIIESLSVQPRMAMCLKQPPGCQFSPTSDIEKEYRYWDKGYIKTPTERNSDVMRLREFPGGMSIYIPSSSGTLLSVQSNESSTGRLDRDVGKEIFLNGYIDTNEHANLYPWESISSSTSPNTSNLPSPSQIVNNRLEARLRGTRKTEYLITTPNNQHLAQQEGLLSFRRKHSLSSSMNMRNAKVVVRYRLSSSKNSENRCTSNQQPLTPYYKTTSSVLCNKLAATLSVPQAQQLCANANNSITNTIKFQPISAAQDGITNATELKELIRLHARDATTMEESLLALK